MNTSTSNTLLTWVAIWVAFTVLGVVTNSEPAAMVGLIGCIVNLAGYSIARLIEKKESK